MDSPTPRLQPPQYIPPPHLANVSFITPEQLTYLFQDFHASLDRIAVAPDFVFDRLVANLSTAVTAFIEQDRKSVAGEYEFYGDSRNDYVEVKIAELNAKVAELEMRSQQQEREIDCLNRENSLLLSAKNYLEGELAKQESRGSGFQPRDYAEEKIDITRSLDDQPKTEIANPQPIASADELEGDNTLSAIREPHAENEESPQIRLETSEIRLDLDEKSCDPQKLRTKITSLESFISSLKADLVEMAVTISVVEIERDEKSSALGLMEKDNAALQSSISGLKMELEDLRSAGSSARSAGLKSFIDSLKVDLAELGEKMLVAETERDQKSTTLELLRAENQTLQSSIDGLEKELRRLRSRNSTDRITGLESFVSSLKSDIAELGAKLLAVEMERDQKSTAVESLQAENKTLQSSIDRHLSEQRSRDSEWFAENDGQIRQLKQEIRRQSSVIDSLNEDIIQLKSNLPAPGVERDDGTSTSEKTQHDQKQLLYSNKQLQAELNRLQSTAFMVELGGGREFSTPQASNCCEETPKVFDHGPLLTATPTMGKFGIGGIESWSGSILPGHVSNAVNFTRPYQFPTAVALGFTSLHIIDTSNVQIRFCSHGTKEDRNRHCSFSWNDTNLRHATCTWLAINPGDPALDYGRLRVRPTCGSNGVLTTTQWIRFPRRYETLPYVLVWFSGIYSRNAKALRLYTFVTCMSLKGFKLNVTTWDTSVELVDVSWVACSKNGRNILCGSFSTLNSVERGASYTGHVEFNNSFTSTPRVFLAINKIDLGCRPDMSFTLNTDKISTERMEWNLSWGAKTQMNSMAASFVALPG